MTTTTPLSVRALAFGGKFIGQAVGFAKIEIFGPHGEWLAGGLADQGAVGGGDGSGVTALIMGQPYPWGYPVCADQAVEFRTELALAEPTVLTFVATSQQDPRISVACKRLVIPQLPLTGAMAVVIVVPGLLVNFIGPAAASAGADALITAQVRMMCGCKIENLFWPVANFTVQATITSPTGAVDTVALNYNGTPSQFAAPYTFASAGDYSIRVSAFEMNGNCGAAAPVVVTVNPD